MSLPQSTSRPFGLHVLPDPYFAYERLRAADGLVWWSDGECWLASRHIDVGRVLLGGEFSAEPPPAQLQWLRARLSPDLARLYETIFYDDFLRSERCRSFLMTALHPHRMFRSVDFMRTLTRDLLDKATSRGRCNVITDLARPLAVAAVGDLLGLATRDWSAVDRWADALADLAALPFEPAAFLYSAETLKGIDEYLDAEVTRRRSGPEEDDVLTALVHMEIGGRRLAHNEIVRTAAFLVYAGIPQISALVGNSFHLLLEHLDQFALLRANPLLAASFVDEVLRMESPLQASPLGGRWASEDLEVSGTEVRQGQQIVTLFGAANRDPAIFTEPDRFDHARPRGRNVAFGIGIHCCLGWLLSRLAGTAAMAVLAEHGVSIARIEPTRWQPSLFYRTPAAVSVRFATAGR